MKRPKAGEALTEQEVEVLSWAAEGKTAEETGMIIGYSAGRITQFIESVLIKLNASNKTHAVAKAIRADLIV